MKDISLLADLPPLLKEIPDPPDQLYYRGSLPDWDNNKFLTVVGSRRFSEYGRSVCEKLIKELAGLPIIIVSGLALGMDTLAHRAALESNIRTISFPGSGLSDSAIAPATNYSLAMDIINSGGALFSEYKPTQKAARWTFPRRNRIMAGMSHAVLIIEAEQKSGTLITSRLATEYNRDVMTGPGSIFRSQAVGPHMLLKLGAYPVTSGADIANHLQLEKITPKIQPELPTANLNPIEQKVWELLSEPRTKQFLMNELPYSITEINIALSAMEIKSLIAESMGQVRRG